MSTDAILVQKLIINIVHCIVFSFCAFTHISSKPRYHFRPRSEIAAANFVLPYVILRAKDSQIAAVSFHFLVWSSARPSEKMLFQLLRCLMEEPK